MTAKSKDLQVQQVNCFYNYAIGLDPVFMLEAIERNARWRVVVPRYPEPDA